MTETRHVNHADKQRMHINNGELVSVQGTDSHDIPTTFYGTIVGDNSFFDSSGKENRLIAIDFIGKAKDVYSQPVGIYHIEDVKFIERGE